MFNKASEKDIDFDLILSGSVTYMTENIITELQLETLISDLAQNSIISVEARGSGLKKILLNIGVTDNCYRLTVEDSGIPFDIETLLNLGKSKVTTHANNGGSGTGLMSAFKIMRDTGASLVITENPTKPQACCKSVAVVFDGKNEYIIKSFRADDIEKKCQRSDVVIEALVKSS